MLEYKLSKNSSVHNNYINQYMHGYCSDLAKSINIKTDLDIYGVINGNHNDHDHYDHYFIYLGDRFFLDITGKRNINEIKQTWSKVFKISDNDVIIEKTLLDDESIGDYKNTNSFADHLITKYGLSYTKKYEKIRDIMNTLVNLKEYNINIKILKSDLFKLIEDNNCYVKNCYETNKDQLTTNKIKIEINENDLKCYYRRFNIKIYIDNKEYIECLTSDESIEVFLYKLSDYIV